MEEKVRKLSMDELERKSVEDFKEGKKLPIVVVLDNVRSMHNVGSVFRTCDAFAIQTLCLCGITATPPHREIEKSALGATQSVEWKHYASTLEAAQQLKADGYELVAVEQVTNSVPLQNFELKTDKPIALIFGNEVNGVSDDVLPLVNTCVEIPQFGTKHSFNISVTAGIVLWQVTTKWIKN